MDITTEVVPSTSITKEIPNLTFSFRFGESGKYELQTNTDSLVECNVSALSIDKYQKIELQEGSEVITKVTEYPADPNPVTRTHIYAKDSNGNFEKFLAAYNTNGIARNNLNSTSLWLFEMMEKHEETVELIDFVKYILYVYNGREIEQTEFEGLKEFFETEDFISATSGGLIVKTDAPGALQALTREQIEQIIQKRFSGKAKANLLSALDGFMYIQNTYHVNAIFAIAVTQKESSCGANLKIGGYNWCSIKGGSGWRQYSSYDEAIRDFGDLIANTSLYFNDSRCTIDSIGERYCVPAEGWIKYVSQFVTEMYECIGITVYSNTGNNIQQKVVKVASDSRSYGISAEGGYCQAWVSRVYYKAGANPSQKSACCAVHAGSQWGVSTNWNDIQLGATVYGYSNVTYGHAGIYIGDGMVAHNVGGVAFDSLTDWIKKYKGVCWGWNGGTDLTGGSFSCRKGLMTPTH